MHRLFIVLLCLACCMKHAAAQEVQVLVDEAGALFYEKSDTILYYRADEKALDGNYARSNYIHPLYTLDGEILTEDFPADHPHHRGIFWAWHQLYIGDEKIGDGWAIEDFYWDVKSIKLLRDVTEGKAIQAEVVWKSPKWADAAGAAKPMVQESTTIHVWPKQMNYRAIDIEIAIMALEPNVRIGGSEDEKGYGGFSVRMRLPDGLVFEGSKGAVTPDNLPIKSGAWLDMSGSLAKGESTAGLSILCHPDNPGFPHPWILRAKRSMQNSVFPFPGAQAVDISEEIPTILRYRLLVHEGSAEALDIDSIYDEYRRN